MPIVAADLHIRGSANRPTDDVSTAGGAIATATRPEFTQLTATSVIAVVSDGADVRTITIEGRLASGAIDTEGLVLTGAAEVVGAKSFERILKVTASAADGARTVTVRQGAGGATRATLNPNETEVYAQFQRSASEAAQTIRYEKAFWRNAHGTLSLLDAQVTLTADPSANIRIGLAGTVDDTATVTNRKTAPGGVTFVDDSVAQNVPGTNLAAGAAIGTWVELTLAADEAAQKTTHTTELAGTTV